ncbi:hypothetical protein [Peribacillus frigoritolerans]|uniref:hypothetical protein n=1 Tax=Peribacillus frigoritolerans TaxID=450367 RepID=UPI0039A3E7AB
MTAVFGIKTKKYISIVSDGRVIKNSTNTVETDMHNKIHRIPSPNNEFIIAVAGNFLIFEDYIFPELKTVFQSQVFGEKDIERVLLEVTTRVLKEKYTEVVSKYTCWKRIVQYFKKENIMELQYLFAAKVNNKLFLNTYIFNNYDLTENEQISTNDITYIGTWRAQIKSILIPNRKGKIISGKNSKQVEGELSKIIKELSLETGKTQINPIGNKTFSDNLKLK